MAAKVAAKHAPRTAAYPVPWSEHATADDAFYFAKREQEKLLAAFHEACQGGQNDSMIAAIKRMRGVVDKLDALRRMKVREWTAAQAANQNVGEVET